MKTPAATNSARLWVLPVIAGLLPALATIAAFRISLAHDLISTCNPFVDGCVSISRAGRYGLANQVFRAIVLPAAVLQGLTWILCAAWLANLGAGGRSLRWIAWLGVLAGVFLVLYGTFLGGEGDAYRWMRRYGVIVYFGFTFLCMSITAVHIRALARSPAARVPARFDAALAVLLLATLLMGLANAFVAPFAGDPEFTHRLENVFEWYAGAAFTLYFFALGWLWRRTRFRASLRTDIT